MSTANRVPPAPTTSTANKTSHAADMTNSSSTRMPAAPVPNQPPPINGKKVKNKKITDPSEAQRLLEAKISQLESDATGEQNEEQEISKDPIFLEEQGSRLPHIRAPSRFWEREREKEREEERKEKFEDDGG